MMICKNNLYQRICFLEIDKKIKTGWDADHCNDRIETYYGWDQTIFKDTKKSKSDHCHYQYRCIYSVVDNWWYDRWAVYG